MSTTFWRLCLLFTFLALPTTTAVAQDEAEQPAEEVKEPDDLLQEWDRLIYVPFQELKDVFDNQKSSAVIPYAEYMELMKIYLESRTVQQASPDAVITSAAYEAAVEGDVVRIKATLEINLVEEDGWKTLNLPFGNCAIGSIDNRADDCLLKGRGNGQYDLWLQGSGSKTVVVNLLTAVVRSPEHQSFSINCPATAIGTLKVTIPKAEQQVSILPLQILLPNEDKEAAEEDVASTVVNASLASTNRFEVRWNPKASSKPVMDLLASVQNSIRVKIEPGLIQTTANLTYEVLRGELTEALVVVPKDARIIDVAATKGQIRSWDVVESKKEQNGQTLKLTLLNPISDQFAVTIETEQDLVGQNVSLLGKSTGGNVHGIHALEVIRETGVLTVSTDSTLTATAKEMSGIKRTRQATKSSLEQQAWSFTGQTGRLVLNVAPVKPRLLANQSASIIFDDDRIRLSSKITYTIEKAGVFQLAIKYPEDLAIDSVRADGMTEFKSDENSGLLTLSLAQKRIGKITVDLQGHRPFDSTVALESVSLPFFDAEGVEREEGNIRILAPPFLDVITIEDSVSGMFPDQEASAQRYRGVVVASAWKYSQKPVALSVRTSPRSAQIAATVATTASIEPNVVAMNSTITFDVKNAGIDTFRISVPAAIAADVRFRSLNSQQSIQQRNQAAPVDGKVIWTLVLQREVTGKVPFAVDWEIPIGTEDDAVENNTEEARNSQFTIDVPEVIAPFEEDAEGRRDVTMTGITGELRLLRHDSLSVSATAVDDSMELIDVRELKQIPTSGYLAFRYFEQPASANVQVTRHEIQEVVKTVVSKAAIEVVTDKQRLANYLCQYEITSSERQRLRVDLPANAELQAPLLNSARTTFEAADAIKPEAGWTSYYVNVGRKSTSDDAFILTLQFRCPITQEGKFPFQGQGSKQVLRLPGLTSADEAVVVQETRLAIYHPEKIALVGDADHWKFTGSPDFDLTNPLVSSNAQEEAEHLRNWIKNAPQATDFARQGHVSVYRALGHQPVIEATWWNRPFLVGIISAAIFLIGLILRRTSWENRLSIVVLVALAVGIWSLQDNSETMQFLTAAIPGLAAVAVIWVVGAFQRLSPPAHSSAPGSDETPPKSPRPTPTPPDQSSDATKTSESAPAVATTPTTKLPPGAVSPSPDVSRLMDDMMGGK